LRSEVDEFIVGALTGEKLANLAVEESQPFCLFRWKL
jgi:hypothetical protein